MQTLKIATFNIHKGFTHFNARFALNHQRDALRKLHADVVFLQELQGHHEKHSARFSAWPSKGQLEFLADTIWPEYAYGKNAVYPAGHHGNALLSKFSIINSHNQDISAHALEDRGMLHAEVQVPEWPIPLHCICLHLGLFARWRKRQIAEVARYIQDFVPDNAPLIIAGDFNDWSARAGQSLAKQIGLQEVFEQHAGAHARSFPSFLPMLKLDRIYVRGLTIHHAHVHAGPSFLRVSDHAILTASLSLIC